MTIYKVVRIWTCIRRNIIEVKVYSHRLEAWRIINAVLQQPFCVLCSRSSFEVAAGRY
ncbi:hypothetical protein RchiOBHm_Chr3g0450901 [Rosa chinensis]|uniref:Uncharacterized protein n=1 Tax=Rosa chinensis TaxID=74649 RepID=A0A2P6R5W7_ROSCH|nr:hypothetical protein RchiOBHm_Chr3g0450901 [Rosa chinensis]